jgi:hypothetical protein
MPKIEIDGLPVIDAPESEEITIAVSGDDMEAGDTAALIAAGYRTLDAQAKALGIHRATAWTIIRTKHKLGRLNLKTTERMLANPQLPPGVRSVVERYLAEQPRRSRQQTSSSKCIARDQPQNAPNGGGVLWGRADQKQKRGKLQS